MWNFKLPKHQKIIKNVTFFTNKKILNSFIPEKKTVIYKLIDVNNLGLLSSDGSSYHVHIINLITGKILYNLKIEEVSPHSPVNFIADENSFFLSFFNKKIKKTEIVNIELFRRRIEKNFYEVIQENMFKERSYLG